MPLFGGKHKTPHELVKIVRDGLVVLSATDVKDEKKIQKVTHLHCLSDHFLLVILQMFGLTYHNSEVVLFFSQLWVIWHFLHGRRWESEVGAKVVARAQRMGDKRNQCQWIKRKPYSVDVFIKTRNVVWRMWCRDCHMAVVCYTVSSCVCLNTLFNSSLHVLSLS